MPALADDAVDALNGLFGRHPGRRAAHARGTFCMARFTATPEAAALTRAAHMQGEPVDAVVRFSNGSGDPEQPDTKRDVRGMAVKLQLPDGSQTDVVAVTGSSFYVRRPEDFVALTRARTGFLWPLKVAAFYRRHPESRRALRSVTGMKPPVSYATSRYNALHAFRWVDATGGDRHVRYSWLPEAGEAGFGRWEARKHEPDYLRREMAARLARGPARFALGLQIAGPGDPLDDPTAVWPERRTTVTAGTLELTALMSDDDHEALVFDPTRVTDGIELTDDPILNFRPRAYAVSAGRRAAETRG